MGLALDLEDYHPSVLLHCWLGHLTCKIVSEMTYNVSNGTLNPTIPYHTIPLSVCLSAYVSQKPHVVISPNFEYTLIVAVARPSADGNAMLCTSGFVDNVSHNGPNMPESRTTRIFRPVRQVATPVGRQTTSFGRIRQMAASEAKSTSPTVFCNICSAKKW